MFSSFHLLKVKYLIYKVNLQTLISFSINDQWITQEYLSNGNWNSYWFPKTLAIINQAHSPFIELNWDFRRSRWFLTREEVQVFELEYFCSSLHLFNLIYQFWLLLKSRLFLAPSNIYISTILILILSLNNISSWSSICLLLCFSFETW